MNRNQRRAHKRKWTNTKEKYTDEEIKQAEQLITDSNRQEMAEHMARNKRMRKQF